MRHMAQAKHIGKIVLRMQDPDVQVLPSRGELASFRADGTYVISGGLGGFGMALVSDIGWDDLRQLEARLGSASGEKE